MSASLLVSLSLSRARACYGSYAGAVPVRSFAVSLFPFKVVNQVWQITHGRVVAGVALNRPQGEAVVGHGLGDGRRERLRGVADACGTREWARLLEGGGEGVVAK